MTWTNKLLIYFLIICPGIGMDFTPRNSFNALKKTTTGTIHATPHITNIIRNGIDQLSHNEITNLPTINLKLQNRKIVSIMPTDLDQFLDTDHFRLHYTLEGTDAVQNVEYVISMSQIYEQVYSFFVDTLGFIPPPTISNNDYDLYDIFIENLPSYYFGVTYTANSQADTPACASYIRMRNNYSGSQFSEHSEIENIKVTAVHEFFHSIQFGYNCYEKLWFMEATAVWSEDQLYNGINDLYRYLPSWFSNPNKAINDESNHMYGTFIFFQYIDEHFGGPETIRSCWENSNSLASPVQDISFQAIDEALLNYNSSFEEAFIRMRIANRILDSDAGIYSYAEAEGYKSVANPPLGENIIFQLGSIETINSSFLDLYESTYYTLESMSPVKIELLENSGDFILSSIVKHKNIDQWTVRSKNIINIDTELDIEWISFIVSAINQGEMNWNYTMKLSDGYSEDFTFYKPYPNPSIGENISIDIQVIEKQKIQINVINILGETVWSSSHTYDEPKYSTTTWNGMDQFGKKVSNGMYFIKVKGKKRDIVHKVIFMKK